MSQTFCPFAGRPTDAENLMAAQEVTPPLSRSRLTPVPRRSQDFDTKHMASLGAERTEIPQRWRLMAGASWLREGSSAKIGAKTSPNPFQSRPNLDPLSI